MTPPPASPNPWPARWQRLKSAFLRGFHAYANWLVSISWKRFVLFALLLVVFAEILQSLPPFRWSVVETIEDPAPAPRVGSTPTPPMPSPPRAPRPSRTASVPGEAEGVDISIDERGIRIVPRAKAPAAAGSAASSASAAASAPVFAASAGGVEIRLPPGADSEAVREAVREARDAIREALREKAAAERARAQAEREAAEAAREVAEARADEAAAALPGPTAKVRRVRNVRWGDFLTDLALLWIIASIVIKATYKGRIQAEVKAAAAVEVAEAESLRRQVVEARMAAMQAQVEPHFLFNTLASIDHLIETDPKRASQMQKNLIALLRASMPTLREAGGGAGNGVRELAREIAVIRPYLEILKVRMEERLTVEIAVPEGLMSAEFPPMMVQTLVENAIKHGLEPKAEGGHLAVRAEIVHGKLAVSVADTGLGFGRAATAGTGVGLANIRERLQLLYGTKASLTVAENTPSGTVVTVTVPYRTMEGATP